MALETLKDLQCIGGFRIIRNKPKDMSWDDFDNLRDEYPINITDKMNCISFKIQDGPIKENGVNGCQVETLIHTAFAILEGLDEKFPSEYNTLAIQCLDQALMHLNNRKVNRELRGVEGTSQA